MGITPLPPQQQADVETVAGEVLPASRYAPAPPKQLVPEGWLTRLQAALRLGIGLRTLDRWRSLGWGPPAASVRGDAGRLILYHESDITTFRHLMLPRKYGRRVLVEGPGGKLYSRANHQLKRAGSMPPPSAVHPAGGQT